jgi:DNA repair photolyase
MILNISGRTDIVAFYSKWFMNRYKEGFVDVRNPFYPTNISRIYFKDVDAILFCTKNPIPIIKHLKEIDKPILFHITLTPYKQDIEPNVPNKKEIIEAIKKISSIIGIDRISVRYDPVFLNNKYNIDYHIKVFNRMCTLLDGYVKTIIISFIDDYKNVRNNINILKIKEFTENDYQQIGINFSKIAASHGMTVQTCYEEKNLVEYGFKKGECLSHQLAYQLTGKANFKSWSARKGKKCNCVEMVDIGAYNTCNHLCKYCYANYDEKKVRINIQKHNPNSSLLIGKINSSDIIKVRTK